MIEGSWVRTSDKWIRIREAQIYRILRIRIRNTDNNNDMIHQEQPNYS